MQIAVMVEAQYLDLRIGTEDREILGCGKVCAFAHGKIQRIVQDLRRKIRGVIVGKISAEEYAFFLCFH